MVDFYKRRLLPALAMMLLGITATFAYDFDVDGIYYNITDTTNGEVEVTYETSSYASYSGDVVIPDTVTYDSVIYTVTGIGRSAFRNSKSMTSVIIPESVTSIGNYAFYACRGLTSIDIPDGVTSLGTYIFQNCNKLASVTIGTGVTVIGQNTFNSCSALTSITLGGGITTINSYAFYNCTVLTSLVFTSSLKTIGNYAFYGCAKLATLEIGDSVATIGNDAFANCSNALTTINIPGTVTSIGKSAFYGCNVLQAINVDSANTRYCSVDGVLYDYAKDTLMSYPAGKTDTLFTMPETVTYIKDYGCYNAVSLTTIDIPDSVTYIGDRAFQGCNDLVNITIPDGVTYVGDYAFYHCTSLKSIKIPYGITSLGKSTFRGCESLIDVELPATLTTIEDEVFYDCYALPSIDIPYGVTSIGESAFRECTTLTSIAFPHKVTDLGYRVIYSKENPNITAVYSFNLTPPTCTKDTPCNTDTYTAATLYVPSSALEDYKNDDMWSQFTTIVGIDVSYDVSVVASVDSAYVGDSLTLTAAITDAEYAYTDTTYTWYVIADGGEAELIADAVAAELAYFPDTTGTYSFYCAVGLNDITVYSDTATVEIVADETTGITNAAATDGYSISVDDGAISVSGTGGIVSVYDITGVKVAQTVADGGAATIVNVPQSGMYILRIGDGKQTVTRKVIVR